MLDRHDFGLIGLRLNRGVTTWGEVWSECRGATCGVLGYEAPAGLDKAGKNLAAPARWIFSCWRGLPVLYLRRP